MKIITSANTDFLPLLQEHLSSLGGLFSPKHIDYFKAYYNYDFIDLSFLIKCVDGDILCLLTKHAWDGVTHYSWYGQPVYLHCAGIPNPQALQLLQTHLGQLLWQNPGIIDYKEPAGDISWLSQTLLLKGMTPRVYAEQIICLAADTAMLAEMRKIFRQNINWGKRNLTCNILDATTITPQDIFDFEAFHIAVAGHRTRSHESWLAQLALILAGESFLIASYYEGRLVGMSLFAAAGRFAYYSVGVYDRSLFNYPLSHYPIWLGIQHARNLGCQELSMGESYYPGVSDSLGRLPSEKECNISHFKRGFGGHIRTSLRFYGMYSKCTE